MDYQLIEALLDKRKHEELRDEWGTIRALLAEVQTRTGFTRKIEVNPPSFKLMEVANGPTVATSTQNGTSEPELTYTPGITKILDPYMMAGVIAHELAHVVRGDTENMKDPKRDFHGIELGADRWAAEHGFGPNLLAAHQKLQTEFLPRVHWNATNDTHPGMQDRIDAIQSYLNHTEKRAA